MNNITYRKATHSDLDSIIALLIEDDLGATREDTYDIAPYQKAFKLIDTDPNQYLMVALQDEEMVGVCHLTIMPSLTFKGTTRMQIEAIRVSEKCRGQGIGELMIKEAIKYGKTHGAGLIQLATNKKRLRAKKFYEKLGFEATHEGMKLYLDEEV